MNLHPLSPLCRVRAAFAAAVTLALAACANAPDVKPDKPFKTADVCADSAIPQGWIRTNDWRGKGCGVEDGASARDEKAAIQLASAADPADEGAQARRIHERHRGEIDDQATAVGHLGESLAELAHGKRLQIADRPADEATPVRHVPLDRQHEHSVCT